MITQDTAARIWRAYREIDAAKKLQADLKETQEKEKARNPDIDKKAATLTDTWGRKRHLQLGIPSGDDSTRIFHVSPQLGESVIRAHIANMEAELREAQEQARMELDRVDA